MPMQIGFPVNVKYLAKISAIMLKLTTNGTIGKILETGLQNDKANSLFNTGRETCISKLNQFKFDPLDISSLYGLIGINFIIVIISFIYYFVFNSDLNYERGNKRGNKIKKNKENQNTITKNWNFPSFNYDLG